MAIVAMKHLRLLGMESEREALLKTMQDLECVEISHIDGSEEALKTGLAKPDDRALLNAQEESRAYRAALAALDRFAPEKKGMFRKRQGVSRASFFDEENERQARAAAEAINADMRRLGEIESERTKNEALRASLTPWLAVDAPLDSTDGVLSLLFGTVGATVTDDALRALSDSLSGLLTWQQASSDKTLRYLLIACHKSVKEQALSALRELGFSTVSFRGLCGTAEENDKKLEAALAALESERREIERRVERFGGNRETLLEASDRAAILLRREEAKSRLVETDKVFLLEGWLPADCCTALEKALEPFTCAVETREPAEDEYPQVPVQLRNNKLTRPLNMVTEMYSLPAYGTLDPNPLMAPFFILFYGIMMADMGYGLLMMIASVIIGKKYRPKGIVHCYSGSAEDAVQLAAQGLYIGFGGACTFKGAKRAAKAISALPLERIVLETDCPYMAPEPVRGTRCDSSLIRYVGAYIAQRFGNWSAALKAAELPSQYKPPREHHYPRYEQEYQRQEVQLLQERKAKRQAKADLVAQRKNRDKARAAANAAKKNEKK